MPNQVRHDVTALRRRRAPTGPVTAVDEARDVFLQQADSIAALADRYAHALVKDPTHGIDVEYKNQEINIDIYIIIEYGTRIKSVAASVANTVRYQVERSLGLPVNEINIHVQGLRISNGE